MRNTFRKCSVRDVDLLIALGRQTYTETFADLNSASSMDESLLEYIGLKQYAKSNMPVNMANSSVSSWVKKWQAVDVRPKKSAYIGYVFKGKNIGHACAVFEDKNGLIFFDPNIGVYKLYNGKTDDFFQLYEKIYADEVATISVTEFIPAKAS